MDQPVQHPYSDRSGFYYKKRRAVRTYYYHYHNYYHYYSHYYIYLYLLFTYSYYLYIYIFIILFIFTNYYIILYYYHYYVRAVNYQNGYDIVTKRVRLTNLVVRNPLYVSLLRLKRRPSRANNLMHNSVFSIFREYGPA